MSPTNSVLVIQSDWNDTLRDNDSSAWVAHKRRGEKGEYGKIGSRTGDSDFHVHARTERTISVTHTPSGKSSIFVAPVAAFSNIHAKGVISVDVGAGGLGVSACTDNKLHVWETCTGEVRRTLEGHLFDVYTCKLFPSGMVVLSGGGDMQLRIWDAATAQCPVVLKGHTAAVLDTAFVERGRNVISVGKDGTARLWHCGTGQCIATLFTAGSTITCCAITHIEGLNTLPEPDDPPGELEHGTEGKVLAVGCEGGEVVLVGVRGRAVVGRFTVGAAVLCVCWPTDTTAAAGLEDGRLVLIDAVSLTSRTLSHDSLSPVESMAAWRGGMLAGRRDGTTQYYTLGGLSPLQLTGPDCDPVYSIAADEGCVYTASRDAVVRKYRSRDISL